MNLEQIEINEISIHISRYSLNILSRAIIDTTFTEHCNNFSHSTAMILVIQMLELYLKSKLFISSPKIIFKGNEKIDFFNSKTISIYDSIKLFNKKYSNCININKVEKFIKKRNSLVHFGIINEKNENISKLTLKFIFELIIPFLEKYFIDDLEYLFDCLGDKDDCIFENYIVDILDEYNIKYSTVIKKKFTYCNN